MTEKELKRLSRLELLEMLVSQIQENEELQKQLNEANEKLRHRDITKEKAGSIAAAALEINEVFKAADKAALQYLENVRRLSNNQEKVCEKMIADAQKRAYDIIKQAEEIAMARKKQADEYYAKVMAMRSSEEKRETPKENVQSEGVISDVSAVSQEENQ